jgi:hypothetical protein
MSGAMHREAKSAQQRRSPWVTLLTSVALVCLLGPGLGACGSSEPLTVGQVVGSWTSDYPPGRVDLELKGDGTYLEHLYEFDTDSALLPDRDHTGAWSIVGDQVVLANVLEVMPEALGENSCRFVYATGWNWELEVVHRLFGGVEVLKIEEVVRFKRVGKDD